MYCLNMFSVIDFVFIIEELTIISSFIMYDSLISLFYNLGQVNVSWFHLARPQCAQWLAHGAILVSLKFDSVMGLGDFMHFELVFVCRVCQIAWE